MRVPRVTDSVAGFGRAQSLSPVADPAARFNRAPCDRLISLLQELGRARARLPFVLIRRYQPLPLGCHVLTTPELMLEGRRW